MKTSRERIQDQLVDVLADIDSLRVQPGDLTEADRNRWALLIARRDRLEAALRHIDNVGWGTFTGW